MLTESGTACQIPEAGGGLREGLPERACSPTPEAGRGGEGFLEGVMEGKGRCAAWEGRRLAGTQAGAPRALCCPLAQLPGFLLRGQGSAEPGGAGG